MVKRSRAEESDAVAAAQQLDAAAEGHGDAARKQKVSRSCVYVAGRRSAWQST